jgi:hypothetical protein
VTIDDQPLDVLRDPSRSAPRGDQCAPREVTSNGTTAAQRARDVELRRGDLGIEQRPVQLQVEQVIESSESGETQPPPSTVHRPRAVIGR